MFTRSRHVRFAFRCPSSILRPFLPPLRAYLRFSRPYLPYPFPSHPHLRSYRLHLGLNHHPPSFSRALKPLLLKKVHRLRYYAVERIISVHTPPRLPLAAYLELGRGKTNGRTYKSTDPSFFRTTFPLGPLPKAKRKIRRRC